MTPKTKKLILFSIRNFSIAIGCILALFAFGIGIHFLNDYFGTAAIGFGFGGIVMLVYLIWMSIGIAKTQVEHEEIRSKQVMETLKKGHFE
jgi:hypothetical protein